MLWAITGVEGEGTVHLEGRDVVIRAGDLVVVPAGEPVSTSSSTAWVRLIWRMESVLLLQPSFQDSLRQAHHLCDPYPRLITNITSAIAVAGNAEIDAGATYINYVLTSTVAAAIAESVGETHDRYRRDRAGHYRRAIGLIEARYLDPGFTAADIARELTFSRQHLHRVFAEVGTTPAREIEVRRARAATAILALIPTRGEQDPDAVAARAGFTSISRMRKAIQRQADRL